VQFTPGIYVGDPTMHGDQHVEAVVAEATGVPSHVVMAEVARQLEETLRS